MIVELVCDNCGKTFERAQEPRSKRVYCSNECRYIGQRKGKMVPCPTCGKEVYRTPSALKQGRKYCSQECWDIARAAEVVSKVCPTCGKEFEVKASISDRYVHCSWECRVTCLDTHICERCGKEFQSSETRWTPRFCSEECRRPPHYINCRNCGKRFRICPGDTDRQFCSFACYRSFQGETLLEKQIRQTLDRLEIHYIQEAPIGRYSVDFLLPDARVALEVDGEYWHQDKRRDARKTRYLQRHGWKVCRISESKIEDATNLANLVIQELKRVADLEIVPLQPRLF